MHKINKKILLLDNTKKSYVTKMIKINEKGLGIMTELSKQISDNRKKFRVDHFDIVVYEYINRYNNKNIILDPPYQRKFRWDIKTQSALIESILIGIPLPPIFAFSNDNFDWEIIDGLQRTTTLINFLTDKKDSQGNFFKFQGCEILTELNGKSLKDLPDAIRNSINNARLRIELVEDTDDAYSQYLLFSRLNSNGEALSPQELRNFLIYKLNPNFYTEITSTLKNLPSFKRIIHLLPKRVDKQEDIEYILRFFICKKIMISQKNDKHKYSNIEDILTNEIQLYLKNTSESQLKNDYKLFIEVFDYIDFIQNGNGFKAFDKPSQSLPNVSVILPAISMHIKKYKSLDKSHVLEIIHDFYNDNTYKKITQQSYSPVKRFFELSLYASAYFYAKIRG